MELILIIMIAISLSMDTFSLALAYGTINMQKKQKYMLSMLVGIFHFIMPLIGMLVGNFVLSIIKIEPSIIVGIILIFIGFQMFVENFKEEEIKNMKIYDFFLFAFAVSIDSFSVGLTLRTISQNHLISPFIFAFFSMIFTYIGLSIGNKVQKLLGKISEIIGGTILVIIGLTYII